MYLNVKHQYWNELIFIKIIYLIITIQNTIHTFRRLLLLVGIAMVIAVVVTVVGVREGSKGCGKQLGAS